jgi:hypothetical protein
VRPRRAPAQQDSAHGLGPTPRRGHICVAGCWCRTGHLCRRLVSPLSHRISVLIMCHRLVSDWVHCNTTLPPGLLLFSTLLGCYVEQDICVAGWCRAQDICVAGDMCAAGESRQKLLAALLSQAALPPCLLLAARRCPPFLACKEQLCRYIYIYIYIAAQKRQIFGSFHLGFPAPGSFETPLP